MGRGLFGMVSSMYNRILCSLWPVSIRTIYVDDSLGIRLDSMPGPS